MARSIKKNQYLKDKGSCSKFYKKLSHSRLRLETKKRIKRGDWETMPLEQELTNQWDICDWRWYIEDDDMLESFHIQKRVDWGWGDGRHFYRLRWKPQVMWFKGKPRLRK
jgi:hypothetical protein